MKFLLLLIQGFGYLKTLFLFLGKIIFLPLYFLGLFIFKYVILNFYKLYLYIRKRTKEFFILYPAKLISIFRSRYFVHLVLFLLAIFVVIGNNIYEIRAETYEHKNLLYYLTSSADEDQALVDELDTGSAVAPEGLVPAAPSGAEPQTEEKPTFLTEVGEIIKPEIPTTLLSRSPRRTFEYYIVQSDDTISSIADKFNLAATTILWENNLGSRDYIRPGDKLVILPTDGISYKVKKGDTLAKLEKKYKIDLGKIAEANSLSLEATLTPGEVLVIPGAAPIAASPPPAPTRLASIKEFFNLPSIQSVIGFIWPTISRRITQYFSWRHHAIDIGVPIGSPLLASADGVVEYAGWGKGGWGNTVVIDHGNGKKTRYSHASKILVAKGEYVAQGEEIALSGSTGRSTGPHVDYRIYIDGTAVNPLKYVK